MQDHCTEHMNWQRQKTYLRTCTRSEDSDQPAHSHSLIKLLIGAFWIAKGVKFLQTYNDVWSDFAHAHADFWSSLWANVKRDAFSRCGSYVHALLQRSRQYHYENKPIQVYWKFYNQKIENFQIKILIFFLFLLKNIDCGYSLEPPRRGSLTSTHNLCFEQK